LVDVDIMVVVDEGAHGPTRTVAEEATVTIGPGDDWATMIGRLLQHHSAKLRWLCRHWRGAWSRIWANR